MDEPALSVADQLAMSAEGGGRGDEFGFGLDDIDWLEPPLAPTLRTSGRRGSGPRNPPVRLAVFVASLILLALVLTLVVNSCAGTGAGSRERAYLGQLAGPAANSQRVGSALGALLAHPVSSPGTLSARLGPLLAASENDLAATQRLRPPARLLQSHQYVIQALTLRVDGLRGMLDALRRQQGRSSRPQTAALLAAQGARLLTSDVLWQDLVQPAAAAQLKQAGITGVSVPVSVFVTHTELVSTNSLLLLLAGPRLASGPATATTLALGDTGPAVAAWQRELNRWLATHPPGKMAPDGSFGPTTQTATQALQRAQGLTPDGIVGKGTRQALAAVIAGTGGLATPGSG